MAADPAIDELFGASFGEFTARRNELARELKGEGDAEAAAEVAALKKPTVAVWLVNQLARRRRREVDLLLDAGHRLRAAHAEAGPAKARRAFDQGREAEREALRRLRTAGEELLREEQGKASDATVDRALATLRAASVTEEGRELLARGRLTEELATTGFDLAASLVPARPAGRPRARPTRDDRAVKAAEAALREAKQRERDASRRLRDAEREVERFRAEAQKAKAAAAKAESELERARRRS